MKWIVLVLVLIVFATVWGATAPVKPQPKNNRYEIAQQNIYEQLNQLNARERLVIKTFPSKENLEHILYERHSYLKGKGVSKAIIFVYTSRVKEQTFPLQWIARLEWNPKAGINYPKLSFDEEQIRPIPEPLITQAKEELFKGFNSDGDTDALKAHLNQWKPIFVGRNNDQVYIQLPNPVIPEHTSKEIILKTFCLNKNKEAEGTFVELTVFNNRLDKKQTFERAQVECP